MSGVIVRIPLWARLSQASPIHRKLRNHGDETTRHLSVMAGRGPTVGARAIAPAAKATGMRPGERDGLGQLDIAFQLDGADSALFLAQF
ncbi:hypothetical protein [Falsiroseomonas sp. HW251]|uniref:hypothetical protein n=1 Tax=Falsiroseomonas sp. HW251 TaxID=3390998 RepID=UPI003D316A13